MASVIDLLLQTKFFRPQPPTLVSRPRLQAQLNAGLVGKLTLVSAPAGFGKTTLITDWLSGLTGDDSQSVKRQSESQDVKSAWLSLDEKDNDPDRFLIYLVAALQTAVPNLGQAVIANRQAPQPLLLETALTYLVNDLARLDGRLLLTLDDYHLITNETIHQALIFLLDNAPPSFHLILITRADPPLPLPRWRVRGQLNEIRVAELRFTAGETAVFLNELMGLALSPEQLDNLEARTEGWIAALQMAALSLRGRSDTAAFVESFTGSHHFILDYLTDEVLRGHPPYIRDFLLKTSILQRFCAELCEEIGEIGRFGNGEAASLNAPDLPLTGQQILDHLDQANLFLIRLDENRRWFRYHHLFAQFLQTRLRRELSAEAIAELHRRASRWFDEQGIDEAAIDHALWAGDEETAVLLIEKYTRAAMNKSELHKILCWVDAIEQARLPLSAQMAVWYGWALLFSGQTDRVPAAVAAIEAQEPTSDSHFQTLTGNVAALRGWLMMFQGDIPQALAFTHEALATLPADDDHVRSTCHLNLGYIYMESGDLVAAMAGFTNARDHAEKAGNLITAVFACTYLANILFQNGDLYAAEQEFHAAIEMGIANHQPYSPAVSVASTGLAGLLIEWNRLDEAQTTLTNAITLLEQTQNRALLAAAYATLSRLRVAQGEFTAAFAALDISDNIARDNDQVTQLGMNESQRAWLHLVSGDLAWANDWATRQMVPAADSLAFEAYRSLLVLGAIWAQQSATASQAVHLLKKGVAIAQEQSFFGVQVQTQILLALAYEVLGERETAVATLETAVRWAEPQGYIRLFANVGPLILPLLQRLPQTPYIQKILTAFPQPHLPHRAFSQSPSVSLPAHIDPLSSRELELLTLLKEGFSNREIAQNLHITVGTTKRHLSNIYSKLGVGSRTQAVAQARSLGLLPD